MLAVALALGAAPAAAAKAKPHTRPPAASPAPVAPPQVAVLHLPDGWRADISFDGSLLGWAVPREGHGHRTLLLLAGPKGDDWASAADTRDARLYRWRLDAPERLEFLGAGFPAGSLEAADLDGDGQDELLLQRDGGIDLVTIPAGGSAGFRALVEDPVLAKPCCGPRMSWDAPTLDDTALRVAVVGAFRTYRRSPNGGVVVVSEQETSKRLSVGSERVSVESPAVRPVGKTSQGRVVFATEPEAMGKRRLRTLLFDPDGPQETQRVESWALFPGAERVVDSAFATLNGAPVLVVTTTSADKLSLLGEKALRLYPLAGDRTRAGDPPMYAATTGINLWQTAEPSILDLDKDGHDDLVLSYWKGLKNAIAALEVYRGTVEGFEKPRTTSFDVEGGEKGFMEFGPDLDGDGHPDLILLATHELQVFPGAAPDRAIAKPVDSRPSRRIALPDLPGTHSSAVSVGAEGFQVSRVYGGLGAPHCLDLDGDGRPEVVFAGDGASGGRVVVVVVR